jgi:hypothetical protein
MTFNESCVLDLPVSQVSAPCTLKLRARAYTPCMGNLEKLYWIDAFAVTGYGVRVGVRVNDGALIERLRSRLPPGAKISPMGIVDRMLSVIQAPPSERRGVKNYHLVYADHVLVGRSHRSDEVLDNYDAHLRVAMAELSRRKLFVHAGVVAWKDKAILLPGRTFTQDSSGRGARQGGRRVFLRRICRPRRGRMGSSVRQTAVGAL